MAKNITFGNPDDKKKETRIQHTSIDSKKDGTEIPSESIPDATAKEKNVITIIKGNLSQDIQSLVRALGLSPESTQDFYRKLNDIVASGSGVIDLEAFSQSISEIVISDKAGLSPIQVEQNARDAVKSIQEISQQTATGNKENSTIERQTATGNKTDSEVSYDNTFGNKENSTIERQTATGNKTDSEVSYDNTFGNKENSTIEQQTATGNKTGDTIIFSQAAENDKTEIEESIPSNTIQKYEGYIDYTLAEDNDKTDTNIEKNKNTTLASDFVATLEGDNKAAKSAENFPLVLNAETGEYEDPVYALDSPINNKTGDIIVLSQITGDSKTANFADITIESSPINNKTDSDIGKKLAAGDTAKRTAITIFDEALEKKDTQNIALEQLLNTARASSTAANTLELLLYDAIPYTLTHAITSAISAVGTLTRDGAFDIRNIPSTILGIFNTAKTISSTVDKMKYYTLPELGLLASASFITLQFGKVGEISIKDLTIGPGIPFSEVGNILRIQKIKSQEFAAEAKSRVEFLSNITFNTDQKIETQINIDDAEEPTGDTKIDLSGNDFGEKEDIDISDLNTNYRVDGDNNKTKADLFDKLKTKADLYKVGSVYVWPIVSSTENVTPKHIPFQFNPSISEGGQTARYEALTILSRLGNLQSYVGTDSLTISLKTDYVPTSYDGGSGEDGWLGVYSMQTVQLIELAYRTLVLPYFVTGGNGSEYKYFKPPLIKILIGDYQNTQGNMNDVKITGTSPYSNMLVYPTNVLDSHNSNRFSSQSSFRNFRTFIATSVQIVKNMDETPIYIDSHDGYIVKDTMGFSVSMNLIEVVPSYSDVQPGFYEYYDTINNALG